MSSDKYAALDAAIIVAVSSRKGSRPGIIMCHYFAEVAQ